MEGREARLLAQLDADYAAAKQRLLTYYDQRHQTCSRTTPQLNSTESAVLVTQGNLSRQDYSSSNIDGADLSSNLPDIADEEPATKTNVSTNKSVAKGPRLSNLASTSTPRVCSSLSKKHLADHLKKVQSSAQAASHEATSSSSHSCVDGSSSSSQKSSLSAAAATQLYNNVLAATSMAMIPFTKLYESLHDALKDQTALIAVLSDKMVKTENFNNFLKNQILREADLTTRWQERLTDLAARHHCQNDTLSEGLLEALKWMRHNVDAVLSHSVLQHPPSTKVPELLATESPTESETNVLPNLAPGQISNSGKNLLVSSTASQNGQLNHSTLTPISIGSQSHLDDSQQNLKSRKDNTEKETNSLSKTSKGAVSDTAQSAAILPKDRNPASAPSISQGMPISFGIFAGAAKSITLSLPDSTANSLKKVKSLRAASKINSKRSHGAIDKSKDNNINKQKKFIRNLPSPTKLSLFTRTTIQEEVAAKVPPISAQTARPTRASVHPSSKRRRTESVSETIVSSESDPEIDLCNLSTYSDLEASLERQNVSAIDGIRSLPPAAQGQSKPTINRRSTLAALCSRTGNETRSVRDHFAHVSDQSSRWNPKCTKHQQSKKVYHVSRAHQNLSSSSTVQIGKLRLQNIQDDDNDVNLNRANVMRLLKCIPSLRTIESADIKIVEYPTEYTADQVILHIPSASVRNTMLRASDELLAFGFDISTEPLAPTKSLNTSSSSPSSKADASISCKELRQSLAAISLRHNQNLQNSRKSTWNNQTPRSRNTKQ
ncbi:serine-rich adhesin for platelets-like [Ambystoma mexicanum]|uniref:serine-rich adhesin for platelets-like n=1 Tax=Ambystoma mexicanum TaxID=8296 RepID=UPI0037E7342C